MENLPDDSEQLPSRPRLPFSWWWPVSVLAFGLILGIGGLELVRLLARPLGLLILAVSISSALAPVVERLSARIPRTAAVILVYAVQIRSLFGRMRVWLPQITNWLAGFGFDPQGLRATILSEAGQFGVMFLRLPVSVGRTIVEIVLILFLSLYWLFLTPGIKRFFLSFFPAGEKGFVTTLIADMGTEMGGYLRGAAINGLIIGAAEYVGLLIIGVPYALTLASLTAFLELFPTIGPVISGAVVTLVALSESPRAALITLALAIVLQQTEGHILVPLIMRSQTNISPLLAVFSIVCGAAVGGLLGAVIAIPIAAVLSLLVRRVIAPAIRRANGVTAEEV
jgi:predicted PurR-regulated permease PerM